MSNFPLEPRARDESNYSTILAFHVAIATLRQLARDVLSGRALLDSKRWARCLARLRFARNTWENMGKRAASAVEFGATSCIRGLTGQSVPESTCRSQPRFSWVLGNLGAFATHLHDTRLSMSISGSINVD